VGVEFQEILVHLLGKRAEVRFDDFLGELARCLENEATLITLSDHSFCSLKKELYINRWLRQKGWLKFTKSPPESWTDIDGTSKAYSLAPGRIYVNLREWEPKGCVEPSEEYERVKEELVEEIGTLKDPHSGEPMIEMVFKREEPYNEPRFPWVPDLVVKPRRGYDTKGSPKKESLTGRGPIVGMHACEDAFLFIPGQDMAKEVVELVDLVPTVPHLMRVPLSSHLEGTIISQPEEFLGKRG